MEFILVRLAGGLPSFPAALCSVQALAQLGAKTHRGHRGKEEEEKQVQPWSCEGHIQMPKWTITGKGVLPRRRGLQ